MVRDAFVIVILVLDNVISDFPAFAGIQEFGLSIAQTHYGTAMFRTFNKSNIRQWNTMR